jgi:peptidyl-prolyl cis-trans isomerase C
MNKSVKNVLIILTFGALALALPWGNSNAFAAKDDELFDNPVVAKGKGFEIKRSEVEDAFTAIKANAAAVNEKIADDRREQLEAELLNEQILTRLLLQKATDADKAKAREAAQETFAKLKARSSSEDIFKWRLRAVGMTVEAFQAQLNEQETRKAVLHREVADKIEISDEAIKKYYEENSSDFDEPERVRAAHILISTSEAGKPVSPDRKKEKETLIRKLKERADKGEDFAKLVKEFSDDPASRNRGGEYTFGRGEMSGPFETAAFALRQGQISEVVETQFGYHIIRLMEKMFARKIPLAEASPKIKEFLKTKEVSKILPTYYETLKQENGVEILDEKMKAAIAEIKGIGTGAAR